MVVHMENDIVMDDPAIPNSTVPKPSFEGIFDDEQELTANQNWVAVPDNGPDGNKIILSQEVKFPPEITYQKMFVTGASGSGKSWTVGVICEEFSRLGLQFVLFDALGAHSGLSQLDNVIEVVPDMSKTVNVERLVDNIASNPNISVVVNLAHVDDPLAQEIVGEYCEELFKKRLGRAVMTIFEECQDLVPQGKSATRSHGPIIKLCKKGRQYGYGVMLVSQRPHEVAKAALTQCTTYIIHNVIQTRDLMAVQDQIAQGVDRKPTRVLIDKIRAFDAGQCLVYSPDLVPKMIGQANVHQVLTQVRGNRSTDHTGDNVIIEIKGGKVWHKEPTSERTIAGMKTSLSGEDILDLEEDFIPQPSTDRAKTVFEDYGKEEDWEIKDFTPAPLTDLRPYNYSVSDSAEEWVADLDGENTLHEKPKFTKQITGYGFIFLLASGMYLLLKPKPE
jgi:hypothetical protein